MRENLDDALTLMFGHEGGYVNDPNDPGGPTKFGITQKTLAAHRGRKVGAADVQALTLQEAETIYRRSYWSQSGGDLLPSGIDYLVFDFGVNSGPSKAVKTLQAVVGVAQDGGVGEMTADAVDGYPGGLAKLVDDYSDRRLAFLKGLKGWKHYGRGWSRRVSDVRANAKRMLQGKPAQVTPNEPLPAPKAKPEKPNAAITPEALSTYVGTATTAISAFSGATGPLAYALAAVVLGSFILAAWFFVRRLRRAEA